MDPDLPAASNRDRCAAGAIATGTAAQNPGSRVMPKAQPAR